MKSINRALLIAGCCLFPFIHPRRHGASAASDSSEEAAASSSFVIAGYLPDYRSYIDVNATAMHLTDLMLFSLTPESIILRTSSSSPGEGCCLSSDHYDQIRKARAYKRERRRRSSERIRLLITVGGAGRSDGFRDVVTGKPQIQRQFLKNLVQLCRDEELDGIDLDFEGIQSLSDWNAYRKFLSTASTYLHRARPRLLLTVALHPGQFLSSHACQSVDRVHVMTYDMMAGRGSDDERADHHASLRSAGEALSEFARNGCPPSKLVMGIPAYGRHGKNAGLVRTYSEVVDEMIRNDGGSGRDVRSARSWKGYRFDSPEDVEAKVEYAAQNDLGGVFFWELGQDKQMPGVAEGGILLESAASSAAKLGKAISDDGRGDAEEEHGNSEESEEL